MATKVPWSVLVTSRNRYILVRAPRYTLVHALRNPAGERQRAGSVIVATAARPIKSTTVVATLLYTTTIYFPKMP